MAIVLSVGLVYALSMGPFAARSAAVQPVPTGSPTLSSTNAYVGATLTVTPGTYMLPASTSDEWYRCSPTCSDTGTSGTSYTVGYADVGDTLMVQETATASDGSGDTYQQNSNSTSTVPAPPTNDSPPVIASSPAPVVGNTLTATQGTWTNADAGSITDTWEDCTGSTCTPIPGTSTTTPTTSYTLTSGDVGDTIEITETATNGGTPANPPVLSLPTTIVQTPSTVSLTASPGAAVTNQGVTLAATVTAQAAGGSPSGAVAFFVKGKAIGGCADQPVNPTGQSVTVLCSTSFGAQAAQLTATFTPAAGSAVLGSSSPTTALTVGLGATTTRLDASAQVAIHAPTTYTATVIPAYSGPIPPSGGVEFLDGGKPIRGCAAQPVVGGGATCTVSYGSTGKRSVSARYLGDGNFSGSLPASRLVRVTTPPAKGNITATMQWTFQYAPTYTRVMSLVINGVPNGATVQVLCHGHGCPFAKHRQTIAKPKPCARKKKKPSCPVPGRVDLTSAFRHQLSPKAQITIEIRRPQYIGKYYSFTFRPRKPPKVRIACLAVDATKPGAGCS